MDIGLNRLGPNAACDREMPGMLPRLYIETSIVSYLTARPSRDLVATARQELTREWWDRRRGDFELYCSQLVIQEAREGDPAAATLRLEQLRHLRKLDVTADATRLARRSVQARIIPREAQDDALHIAIATSHGMEYLLTWNFSHIANAEIRKALAVFCTTIRLQLPVISTPEELLGE